MVEPPPPVAHTLETPRTARWFSLRSDETPIADVWFLLHGYLQTADTFLEWFRPAAVPGRLLVAAEGLSRTYADREQQRVGVSWMTRRDRDHEIRDYTRYLTRLAGEVLTGLDRPRIEVHGFSQGAATACRWVAADDRLVDRLVLWGGATPPDVDLARLAGRCREPVHLVVGRGDRYILPEAVEAETERLCAHAVPHRLFWHPGGHVVDLAALDSALVPPGLHR